MIVFLLNLQLQKSTNLSIKKIPIVLRLLVWLALSIHYSIQKSQQLALH
ncbi:hypothetical protein HMPREF1321_1354 [Capnocytophaga sp. oral taxon 412 str. F0487]|nr:hypothetical protein HMPREF1321_1354 [Capnocytophaga sp. oral taxon 412 str. F0487]